MPKSTTTSSGKNSATLIANIYAYLVLAIGVSVLAVGMYLLAKNMTGRLLLAQYPIGYEESRCDVFTQPYYPPIEPMMYQDGATMPDADATQQKMEEQNRKSKEECMNQLNEIRVRKASTDFYESLALVFVGALLVVPHAVFAHRLKR